MNKVFLLFSLLLLLIATAVAPTPPVIQLTPTVTATSSITETATVVLTETATATATATTILRPTPSTTPTETATPTITPTPNNGRPELADELVLNSQLSDRFDEGSGDIAYYRLLAQAEVDYGCQVRAGGVDTLLRVWQGTTLISENDNQAVGDINPLVSWQIQAEAEREWILLEVVRLAGTGPYTVLCEANLTVMADPEINYSTTPIPHNGDPEQATELVLNNPLSDRFEAGRGDSAYYRLFAQPAVNYGCEIQASEVDSALRVWQETALIVESDDQEIGDINPLVQWQMQASAERIWVVLEVVRLAGTGSYTIECEAAEDLEALNRGSVGQGHMDSTPNSTTLGPTPTPILTIMTDTVAVDTAIASAIEARLLPPIIEPPLIKPETFFDLTFFVDLNGNKNPDVGEGVRAVTVYFLNARGEVVTQLQTNDRGQVQWLTTQPVQAVLVPVYNQWSKLVSGETTISEAIQVDQPELPSVLP